MRSIFRRRDPVDWQLLRAVSRSFYLTLRLLPRAVRSSMTLAYLLARASDTIADTSSMRKATRLRVLRHLQEFTQNEGLEYDFRLARVLAEYQSHPAERQLLKCLTKLMKELDVNLDNKEIREVWSTILKGQIFDLEHPCSVPLQSEQLDLYTYCVAGCVGRFWTQLCFRKMGKFSSLPIQQMEELGIFYGKGLQLINILRDRKEDALRGRIYILEEDREKYRQIAFTAMQAGAKYAMALKSPLLRYATLLPAFIGIRTLELLGHPSGKTKISRKEVYQILFAALPCLWKAQFALR